MKKIIIGLIICVLLLAIPLSIAGYRFNLKENKPERFEQIITKCNKDSDCYKISSTCCPCSSGGTEEAVNKVGVRYYSQYQSTCGEVIRCVDVYLCTDRQPVCEDRRCMLK